MSDDEPQIFSRVDKYVADNNPREFREKLFDLVEEHFPKGKCKERGEAMVLVAFALQAHQSQLSQIKEAVLAEKFTIVSPETESEAMEVVSVEAIKQIFKAFRERGEL